MAKQTKNDELYIYIEKSIKFDMIIKDLLSDLTIPTGADRTDEEIEEYTEENVRSNFDTTELLKRYVPKEMITPYMKKLKEQAIKDRDSNRRWEEEWRQRRERERKEREELEALRKEKENNGNADTNVE